MAKITAVLEELAKRAASGDAVAKQGLRAYHGTADDIQSFDLRKRGASTKAQSAKDAFWFVDNPSVAAGYAKYAAEDVPVQRLIDQSYAAEREGKWDEANELMAEAERLEGSRELVGGGGQNIVPVDIDDVDLLEIDMDGAFYDPEDTPLGELIKQAKSEGKKGLKIKNFVDNADYSDDTSATHYAVFNPEDIKLAFRKYAIGPAASAAVLAGSMTPEEAQAGPLSAGRRIIDPRFTNALGGGPRKGLQESVETIGATVDQRAMNMGAASNLYDYEGSPYMLTQSDRSSAGGTLTSIYGKDIDPVNLRGGRDYMFDPDTRDLVWASDPNVVSNLAKRAAQLRKEFGKDPILLPYAMAPTGIDFATMPLDTMINYARQGMSKANVKKLDTQIKKVVPGWTSVMDPTANAMFRNVGGDKRKAVANIIDKNFRNVNGGLSISEARAATTDAGQYLTPDGTLRNVGRIDTSRPIGTSDHPTYRGGLPGEGVGTLKEDLNVRPFMENAGRELTGDSADIRSLSMNPSFSQGVIDEQLLRKIYDDQGPRLQEIATKYGVSIPVAAMALMGGPEEAQAGPLRGAGDIARQNMIRLRKAADEKAEIGSVAKSQGSYASWDIGNDSYEKYNPATGEMDDIELPDYALIEKLYVPPEQRGAGKGRRLLVEAVDEIRAERGNIDIRLTADPFGEGKMAPPELVGYYEDMGFELDGGSDTSMTLKHPTNLNKYRAATMGGTLATAAGSASASDGGMGVQSPQAAEDEIPWAPEPAATGGELMAKANQGFLDSIMSQPGSMLDPNTYDDIANTGRGMFDTAAGAMGDIESALVGGIMQGIGGVGSWEDALKMLGGGLGQEIASTPDAGSKFVEGMEDYRSIFPTSQTIGDQPGIIPDFGREDEERAGRFRDLGGFVSPI